MVNFDRTWNGETIAEVLDMGGGPKKMAAQRAKQRAVAKKRSQEAEAVTSTPAEEDASTVTSSNPTAQGRGTGFGPEHYLDEGHSETDEPSRNEPVSEEPPAPEVPVVEIELQPEMVHQLQPGLKGQRVMFIGEQIGSCSLRFRAVSVEAMPEQGASASL